jgi:hypothetical protein
METHVTDIPKNPSLTLSRRSLLRDGTAAFTAGGAVILAAAFFPSGTDAAAKVSQAAAGYQTSPKNGQKCENCKNFKPPSSCQLVDGEISPNGWCKFYAKKG